MTEGNGTPLGPLSPASDDIAALHALVEGTARNIGQEFFQSLVRHLAAAVGVRYAFVAEFAGPTRARTLAYWFRDRFHENVEWELAGTPCEEVVRGRLCHHPQGVKDQFPDDKPMVDWGIESYLGVPLCDARGRHLGHLAVFDERTMPSAPRLLYTFRIFAARAAAELERLRFEQMLKESEERYRELYEEAPNAYTITDLSGKLLNVNRRATELLGYPADELIGSSIFDYVPATGDAQEQARRAYGPTTTAGDLSAAECEFRRRDGSPLYASLWVKRLRGPAGEITGTRSIWIDVTDRVLAEREQARLREQNLYLQEEIKSSHNFEEIVGQSPALSSVLNDVSRVAATDSTVLITGETGTGKELVARAIHSASRRRDRPLVKINCAALPASLVESELFGHEKGAFTGAIARRIGRFELADGGTIFLDEVGELPADTQAKLLRVLQEREFDRVGGTRPIKVDVRVIAATNRDLQTAVRDKIFREDLFYRLNVFPIRLPPLRDRAGDIPLLVPFLVARFAARIGKQIDNVSRETLDMLQAYAWPGNVRELENVLERAVVLATGPTLEIDPEVLPIPEGGAADPAASLQAVERNHILAVLGQTGWVIEGTAGAAPILGLHPNTLRSRMKKLGVNRATHDRS